MSDTVRIGNRLYLFDFFVAILKALRYTTLLLFL